MPEFPLSLISSPIFRVAFCTDGTISLHIPLSATQNPSETYPICIAHSYLTMNNCNFHPCLPLYRVTVLQWLYQRSIRHYQCWCYSLITHAYVSNDAWAWCFYFRHEPRSPNCSFSIIRFSVRMWCLPLGFHRMHELRPSTSFTPRWSCSCVSQIIQNPSVTSYVSQETVQHILN